MILRDQIIPLRWMVQCKVKLITATFDFINPPYMWMTQIFNLFTQNLIILSPLDQERVKWKKYKPHSPWCEGH
jgi:hypothetical protein